MLSITAVALVGLYLGLFLGPSATPKLGLDLRGGTQVILTATPLHGGKITKGALNQAVEIIRQRVDAAGVGGAAINTQGSNDIIVSAPGANRDQLAALDATALLRFRLVLAQAAGATAPVTVPTPTPAATKTPAPKKSATPKTTTTSHDVVNPALVQATTAATPSPSPTPSGSPSPSASPTGSSKTSPVPGAASTDFATVAATFETYDCARQGNSPTRGLDEPNDYIVACSADGAVKYLLAPAAVEGAEIKSASATISTQTNQWQVLLDFSSKGSNQWFNLTKKAYGLTASCPTTPSTTGCNSIAITLDGVVQSAPSSNTNGIPGGQTQITGSFTQKQANDLANVLKFGALPLKLEKVDVSSVSATLGSDQLRGGLIAGAIGLFLVILYSLLYYRALGLVTIASLALSGAMLYAVTTELGHSSLGYTLSLPGIAGFIVAVGITADSFVVFFERLRDEVREGKRLRSAVERAWPRARRTIISADAVSLLAAVVLYLVSIGDVRGFAFTLGLSTISDLFIVFFFTKPLLTVVGRMKAFDRGAAWTGVGRARSGATLEPREA